MLKGGSLACQLVLGDGGTASTQYDTQYADAVNAMIRKQADRAHPIIGRQVMAWRAGEGD